MGNIAVDNVVSLFGDTNKENTGHISVYDQIKRFLRELSRSSKNTSDAYGRDIKSFFLRTRNKSLPQLNRNDLLYSIEEIEDYQAYLIDKLGLSISTSNRHITAISECMRHLYTRGYIEDISFLDISRPKATPDSYDGLTSEEIEKIINYVSKKGREETARNKAMLVKYSYDTCSRREECMSLRWSDFTVLDDKRVSVRSIAKGKTVMNRRISMKLYQELLTLKKDGSDKVFNISDSTVDRMMTDIRKMLGVDPNNRRIVFHSIRKAGAQFIWKKTRDLNQVSQALGHASIQTTELYINKNEDYGVLGAISSAHNADEKLYSKVSHEDLLKAIDNLNMDNKLFINLKLEEMNSKV